MMIFIYGDHFRPISCIVLFTLYDSEFGNNVGVEVDGY